MSTFFPMPKVGFRFDAVRGYTSLDGKGRPVWDIKGKGGNWTYVHNKTGKIQKEHPDK